MMKKVVLSLAGVVAATTFAPAASALPLFARQTGMACSACHFQHFPMLNAFGRSFKASGFTLMGAEGKVEGDNLSIPATLNAAILTTAGYTRTNGTGQGPVAGGTNAHGTGFFVPGTNGEFSLFVGGRVSDFAGALAELGMLHNQTGSGAGLASAKIPMLWDIGNGTRVGVVPFTTNSQGASYGFEYLNTGANAVHTMQFVQGDMNNSIAGVLSAQQYIGTSGFATGAAVVANNDMGFINITKYHNLGPNDLRNGVTAGAKGTQTKLNAYSASLGSTYARVAGTFDMAGWDSAVGVQNWSGKSAGNNAATTAYTQYTTKAWAIDGQMQGSLGGMPVGFYAEYARAPSVGTASAANPVNLYNGGTMTRSSFNISTEVGVIPEKVTVSAALRRGKSGTADAAGNNESDNAYLLGASYKLAQNMLLQFNYTHQSGDYWNAANAAANNTAAIGSTQETLSIATIF
jgi:hypothetical protein